ncbi:hypothetical protein [Streptomyces sp. XD-27]|uniref:hypothetical protein n=1 Tax=Streptomyces sp. XD-27 TaxID=3062779 RepID=UPI0026F41918|nr:hypothetical protein [Streptomyces sp. XD-27]WKX69189.1 hypothetical protein Q3Y56_03955 [Streptomyces sp. XD-27]
MPHKKTLFATVALGMTLTLTGCNDDGSSADDAAESKAPSAASSAPSQDATKPSAPASSSAPSGATGDQPMVAGWQTQTRGEHHFRYDVPAESKKWKVLDQDLAVSYTGKDGKPIVVMTGVSHYREGGCASTPNPKAFGQAGKGQLGTVGTTGGGKDGTLQENARNWAGNWGFTAYGGEDNKPKMEVGQARPWKRNGIDGYTATAKVTVTNRPSPCVPPTAIVHSIAQKLPDGTMHGWVIYADQGVPNALTSAEIEKIMNTVRPTEG